MYDHYVDYIERILASHAMPLRVTIEDTPAGCAVRMPYCEVRREILEQISVLTGMRVAGFAGMPECGTVVVLERRAAWGGDAEWEK